MATDGEFNSLRTQGETRPIHHWQLIHDTTENVTRQEKTLLKTLPKLGGVFYSTLLYETHTTLLYETHTHTCTILCIL